MCARGAASPASARADAVAADPALPARALDDGERSRGVETDALGERERLGGAGKVDRREQVVDELRARAVAERDRRGETRGRRARPATPHDARRRGRARHHQAHRSGACPRGAARHRRFDPVDAEPVEARGDRRDAVAARSSGRGGRRRPARPRGDAVAAEENVVGLRGVDDGDDHDLAAARQRGRRRARRRAAALRHRLAVGADVANGDRAAALAEPRRHRQPHVADADHARAALVHATIVPASFRRERAARRAKPFGPMLLGPIARHNGLGRREQTPARSARSQGMSHGGPRRCPRRHTKGGSTMDEANRFAPPGAQVADVAHDGQVQPVRLWPPSGRIGRLRFLAYSMGLYALVALASFALALLAAFASGGSEVATTAVVALTVIAYTVAGVTLLIQRSHDMNLSGWWSLAALIPLVSLVCDLQGRHARRQSLGCAAAAERPGGPGLRIDPADRVHRRHHRCRRDTRLPGLHAARQRRCAAVIVAAAAARTFSRADDAARAAASAARARRGCRSSSSRCRRGRAASARRAGRRRG